MSQKHYLPKNYTYTEETVDVRESSRTFRVKEIVDEYSARVWLEAFSAENKVTWRVLRTFPNSGKINIFKLWLRCQHSTDKRAKGIRFSSKNTNCPAELIIVVKRYVGKSRAKSKDPLTKIFPAVVTLKDEHNHALSSAEVLRYRDLSPEVKEKLCNLFRNGHSTSTALHFHKFDLMLEHGEKYHEVVEDGKYVPSLSIVSKLFVKEFAAEDDDLNGEEVCHNLEKLLKEFVNNTNGKAIFKYSQYGRHYFVVICTPIMLRVHEKIVQSSEIVMLEVTGGVDRRRHRVCVLLTPSIAGDLPLGVIITDTEEGVVLSESLSYFKKLIGGSGFYSKTEPRVFFISDNIVNEISILENGFPTSEKFFCQFHVLKSMWSWLQNVKHRIEFEHRQEAYLKFKKLSYSSDEHCANINLISLIFYAKENKYEHLVYRITELWKKKELWVSCFRHSLSFPRNNTTNYVEIVFRILQDCILRGVLGFNLVQLVDFIVTRYELYMKQRLTEFSEGRYSSYMLKNMFPHEYDPGEFQVHFDTENSCKVENAETEECHTVDLVTGICSCALFCLRRLCRHSCAALISLEDKIKTAYDLVSVKDKEDIFFIAQGKLPHPKRFLPLDNLCKAEVETKTMYLEEKDEDNSQEHNNGSENMDFAMEVVVMEDGKLQLEGTSTQMKQLMEDPQTEWLLLLNNADSSYISEKSETELIYVEEKHEDKKKKHANDAVDVGDSVEQEEEKERTFTVEEAEQQLDNILTRIKEGLKSNPKVFVPGVRKFLQNEKTFARSKEGLISALQNFGTCNEDKLQPDEATSDKQNTNPKCNFGVQPTAIVKRKSSLVEKRKFGVGKSRLRPILPKPSMEHVYTAVGSLFLRLEDNTPFVAFFDNECLVSTNTAE